MEMLHYLREREYGVNRLKKSVDHYLIEKLNCVPTQQQLLGIPLQFLSCKFSRNKNNLHILGSTTVDGKIEIKNTLNINYKVERIKQNSVHVYPIIDFAWAEPQMKLVTTSVDKTSMICNVLPSGSVVPSRIINHDNSVAYSVKFSPGSSDIIGFGFKNGSIKIWDARINRNCDALCITHRIPRAHSIFDQNPIGSLSTIIFKDSQHILSSSNSDNNIKLWDLRKIHSQVQEQLPTPILTFNNTNNRIGYMDMVINSNATHLYASNTNNVIDCYLLDSTDTNSKFQYTGFESGIRLAKLSINHDGRYLFSGCKYKGGVIWVTDFPNIEEPMFELTNYFTNKIKELSSSDWCADPNCPKLATCFHLDLLTPKVWTTFRLIPNYYDAKFNKTSSYKKLNLKKNYTMPIRLESELVEEYKKQTEESMNNWYLEKPHLVSTTDNSQVSPELDSSPGSEQIPVETSCNKRKREPSTVN